MSDTEEQIRQLEERLRQAELGPDPTVFESLLDDDFVLVFDEQISRPKKHIVAAHTPGKGQKFQSVKMSDVQIVDHGSTVVVTCTGAFEGEKGEFAMKFMRVWAKKPEGWKVVGGSMFMVDPKKDLKEYDVFNKEQARSTK